MLSEKEQYEVAIAALLHDIGKFKQRAYGGKEPGNICKQAADMEGQLLPVFEQRYSYRHSLWSYDFFLQDLLPLIRSKHLELGLDWERIARESSSHHNPSDGISKFIAKADRISAGADRVYGQALESGEYLKRPLRSLFQAIGVDSAKPDRMSDYAYSMEKAGSSCYPRKDLNLSKVPESYSSLWKGFIEGLKAIASCGSLLQLLSKLKDLMFEYCWCIPSATNDDLNDISLYDHSITTMALAIALSCSDDAEKPFRMFAADLSGIQSFIFQSNKASFPGAARVFRGRSFIISAISTAYRMEVYDATGIIPFTDIIDAGGKFTMILPSSKDIVAQLDKLQKEQEEFFLRKYLGTLCVLSDYSMNVSPEAFGAKMDIASEKTGFCQTQKELGRRLNSQKMRKFAHVDLKGQWVMNDVDMSGARCKACGIRGEKDDNGFCPVCKEQADLGGMIPTKPYLSFRKDSESGVHITAHYSVVLGEKKASKELCYSLQDEDDSLPSWRLNTHTPANMDFGDIADCAVEDGKGKPFLAYVKLDVDSLGEIFIHGLPSKIYTLSRYVTLSRMLNMFFNVTVKQILENRYPYAYTVISGGDDVFLILPWNQAVSLINELRSRFTQFCCNNDEVHFSTGIVVTGKSVPFALVNKQANEALDDGAKKAPGKNSVQYFGQVLSYEQLLQVYTNAFTIQQFMDDSECPVTSSFVYRMYGYVNDRLSDAPARAFSSSSKVFYDIARNLSKGNEKLAMQAKEFFLSFVKMSKKDLKMFQVSLIHAMYSQRTSDKEEDAQ